MRALDHLADKVAETAEEQRGSIARLLGRWNGLATHEKETVLAVVATALTAGIGMAATSLKSRDESKKKKVTKKEMKKSGRKALKKMTKALS